MKKDHDLKTDAFLIKRIPSESVEDHGCIRVDNIPINEPAIVAFGGELTNSDRRANSYAKMLETLFKENNITKISIYSVVYSFKTHDTKAERNALFLKAKQKLIEIQENNTPNYVNTLFNILLYPRITNSLGKRLTIEEAIKRIRLIKFYAHCHGAATIWQMSNLMYEKMLYLGYKKTEIQKIQKNLLVIQHSPIAPMNSFKFTTLSFASAEDTMTNKNNTLSEYLYENSGDIVPSFFAEPYGNIFIAGKLKETSFQEHDHRGLLKTDEKYGALTQDGEIIFNAERNALINSANQSIQGGELPSIEKIVSGSGVDFKELKSNGDFLIKVMQKDLSQQILKPDYQK